MAGTAQMANRADVDAIRISTRAGSMRAEPFLLFKIDDYLPAPAYRALTETFPRDEYFVREEHTTKLGTKRLFSTIRTPDVFRAFCDSEPVWRELYERFSSRAFMADVSRVLRGGLVRARGLGGLKIWRHVEDDVRGLRQLWTQRVIPHFEFSQLGAGSYILPHTDAPTKLVSLILYFAEPDWRPEYGGGTDFYRGRERGLNGNWANLTVPFEAVERFESFAFVPNRLLVFVKSANSYHGVSPITCPPGMQRKSLNVNYLLHREGLPSRVRRRMVNGAVERAAANAEGR